MKHADRFLVAIVIGVVVLVAAAFAAVLLRQPPSYRTDASPDATVHNYLLALQQEEYWQALDTMSTRVSNRPEDPFEFEQVVHEHPGFFERSSDVTISIASTRIDGDDASVTVRETHSGGGFPGDVYTDEAHLRLKLEEGGWKIVDGDRYWLNSWRYRAP